MYINPTISGFAGPLLRTKKGCSRCPTSPGRSSSARAGRRSGVRRTGREFTGGAGLLARSCWQHELDHLEGSADPQPRMSQVSRRRLAARVARPGEADRTLNTRGSTPAGNDTPSMVSAVIVRRGLCCPPKLAARRYVNGGWSSGRMETVGGRPPPTSIPCSWSLVSIWFRPRRQTQARSAQRRGAEDVPPLPSAVPTPAPVRAPSASRPATRIDRTAAVDSPILNLARSETVGPPFATAFSICSTMMISRRSVVNAGGVRRYAIGTDQDRTRAGVHPPLPVRSRGTVSNSDVADHVAEEARAVVIVTT